MSTTTRVGTYRDDEVGEDHALHRLRARMGKQGQAALLEVVLSPLTEEHVAELLADTLGRPSGAPAIAELAALCLAHSRGNPFMVREFLGQWHEDGLICLRRDRDGMPFWDWNLAALAQGSVTDAAAALMSKRLARLSEPALRALGHAACVGTRFTLSLLVATMGEEVSVCAAWMQQAAAENLIFVDASGERTLTLIMHRDRSSGPGTDSRDSGSLGIEFRFRHDRIRAAAHENLPADDRARVHLTLARVMRQRWHSEHGGENAERQAEGLFAALQHYSHVWQLLDDWEERIQVARDNLRAAMRATSAAAYSVVIDYCRIGTALVEVEGRQLPRALVLALYRTWARAELMSGHSERCEALVGHALLYCDSDLERVHVCIIRVDNYIRQSKFGDAVAVALECFSSLGISVPEPGGAAAATAELETRLGDGWAQWIAESVVLSVEEVSPRLLALAELLNVSVMALFFVDRSLWQWALLMLTDEFCDGVTLSMASAAYMGAAMRLAAAGDYRGAWSLSRSSIEAARQDFVPGTLCQVVSTMAGFILHWGMPLRSLRPLYDEADMDGRGTGSLVWRANLALSSVVQEFYAGTDLPQIHRLIVKSRRRNLHHHLYLLHSLLDILQAAVASLDRGPESPESPESLGAMRPAGMSEEDYLAHLRAHGANSIGYFWTIKAQLLCLHGDFQVAEAAATQAASTLYVAGQFAMIARLYYHLLAHICQCEAPSEDELNAGGSFDCQLWHSGMADMARWAEIAPMNCRHYLLTLEAEYARAIGEPWSAMPLYHEARKVASDGGFVHDVGFIHERIAQQWLVFNSLDSAYLNLDKARKAFASWGARTKVVMLARALAVLGERLRAENDNQDVPVSTVMTSVSESAFAHGSNRSGSEVAGGLGVRLELGAVLKASHAISGELVLDELSARLLQVTLESAGAQRGCLLRPDDKGHWYVELEAHIAPAFAARPVGTVLSQSGAYLPVAAVDYVRRTNKELVLGDVRQRSQYASDPYVVANGLKSLLCIPIATEERSVGMLYLENRLIGDAFSRDRVELMRILAAQAAIALENARLFRELKDTNRNLEDLVERRTSELRAAQNELLMQAHRAGRAELAIDTVHNIGNALNSVRVNAAYIGELLARPAAGRYGKAHALLAAHRDNLGDFLTRDPRGSKLVEYYLKLEALCQSQQEQLLACTQDLLAQVGVIEDIVKLWVERMS